MSYGAWAYLTTFSQSMSKNCRRPRNNETRAMTVFPKADPKATIITHFTRAASQTYHGHSAPTLESPCDDVSLARCIPCVIPAQAGRVPKRDTSRLGSPIHPRRDFPGPPLSQG